MTFVASPCGRPARRLKTPLLVALMMLTTLLLAAWSAPRADASARKVPKGFYGVVLNPQVVAGISNSSLNAQMALMARSGVESVRLNFYWSEFEPNKNHYDWNVIDPIVAAAASHGLQILPVVEFTPTWASSNPHSRTPNLYPPTSASTYAAAMTALVKRYGPKGSFWHGSGVPRDPITAWQVWNEPAGNWDWLTLHHEPWAKPYGVLLKAAYKAIHAADHRATVVSAALVGATGGATPWGEAASLYRLGYKRYFDVVAINAYSGSPSVQNSVDRVIKIISILRGVMDQHGDRHKPIWLTEVTWTAAAGKLRLRSQYIDIETTPSGQAQRLGRFMSEAASHPDGISRVFWYTWASPYQPTFEFGTPPTFQYAGLVQWNTNQPFQALPLLSSYANVVARYEGCRKNSSGRCG